MVINNGRLLGGDNGYYYFGTYKITGNDINATITVVKYDANSTSIFGNIDHFQLTVSGKNDTEANIFGYMDIQLKARLKSANEPDSSEEISKIPFEIQVRTIAQDAWASISHYLDYKKPSTVPKQLKRDFHALSGLFYVADTHFLFLKQEQSKTYFNT